MSESRRQDAKENKEAKSFISLPKIDGVIQLLKSFDNEKDTSMCVGYLLMRLHQLNCNTLTQTQLDGLQEKIVKWSKDTSINAVIINGVSFQQALEKTLLAFPKNIEDFADGENITPDNRIVTSDGYQFNIESLVHWINEKKEYHNPYTNREFGKTDQEAILDFAKTKGLLIDITTPRLPPEEDPTMLAAAIPIARGRSNIRIPFPPQLQQFLQGSPRNFYDYESHINSTLFAADVVRLNRVFTTPMRYPALFDRFSIQRRQDRVAPSFSFSSGPDFLTCFLIHYTLTVSLLIVQIPINIATTLQLIRFIYSILFTNQTCLVTIAKSRPDAVAFILQTLELRNKLLSASDPLEIANILTALAISHPDTAKLILQTRELRDQLLPVINVPVANPQVAIARSRIETIKHNKQILTKIAASHPDAAAFIIDTPELRNKFLPQEGILRAANRTTMFSAQNTQRNSQEEKQNSIRPPHKRRDSI